MNISDLNPEYTFDTFVVGSSNRFAHDTAVWFSAQYVSISYNCQLFIYGNTGLGKTHLLQSAARYIKNEKPAAVILYLTMEEFYNDLISEIRSGNHTEFTKKYISADALIIDDCEYIARKTTCQEDLVSILKARSVGKNITVLAAADEPDAISELSADLTIQLKNGVIADIQNPELSTRYEILEHVLSETDNIPHDVIDFIALNFKTNIQTMKNVLNQAILTADLNKSPLTLETAKEAAVHFASEQNHYRSIETIVTEELNNILFPGAPLKTGFTEYDNLTGGLHQKDLVLIAAHPGMGKTTFILNIAGHLALREKVPVLFFSLELSDTQIVHKMIVQESGIRNFEIFHKLDQVWGIHDSKKNEQILEAAKRIATSDLIIDDTPAITIKELCDKCWDYKRKYDIKAIFIDYLQLLLQNQENKETEYQEIFKTLKALAKKLEIPIIVTFQTCKEIELLDDNPPLMRDLTQTVPHAHIADQILFISRDDYYHEDSEDQGIAKIIIPFHRNGPLGTVKLTWAPEYGRFTNIVDPSSP